jgi:beta-lactamase class D
VDWFWLNNQLKITAYQQVDFLREVARAGADDLGAELRHAR